VGRSFARPTRGARGPTRTGDLLLRRLHFTETSAYTYRKVIDHVIMELMGHEDLRTLMHYIAARAGRNQDAIAAMAGLMG
jgi:hypothetical protein